MRKQLGPGSPGWPLSVMRTTDHGGIATTSLTSVGLALPAVAAGTYQFHFEVSYLKVSTAAAFRLALTGPTLTTLRMFKKMPSTTANQFTTTYVTAYDDSGTDTSGTTGASTPLLATLSGWISVSAAGQVELRAARSGSGTPVIQAGSHGWIKPAPMPT